MASIRLDKVTKRFGSVTALQGVSLEVADGEFFAVLGPPGAGKTTLLRTIIGLERPDEGDVYLDGERITDVYPGDRNIAIMFQNLALYPDKSVYNNLAFPLRQAKTPKAEISRRVDETAAKLHIEHLLKRKPAKLSGGERQRVALGRALVRDPRAFLLDEPLSALDALLRLEMRAELKRLQRDLGRTLIYVTHDQVEAMSMPDRVAVLREGVVQQVDAPENIYHSPANRFVATVVGSPPMNFIAVKVTNANGKLRAEHASFVVESLGDTGDSLNQLEEGGVCYVGIRPEDVTIVQQGEGIPTTVYATEPLGGETIVDLELGRQVIKSHRAADSQSADRCEDRDPPRRAADPRVRRRRPSCDVRSRSRRRVRRLVRLISSAARRSMGSAVAALPCLDEAFTAAPDHLGGVELHERVRIVLAREDLHVVPAAVAACLEGADDRREIHDALPGERAVVPASRFASPVVDMHHREPRGEPLRVLEDVGGVPEVPGVKENPDRVVAGLVQERLRTREVGDQRELGVRRAVDRLDPDPDAGFAADRAELPDALDHDRPGLLLVPFARRAGQEHDHLGLVRGETADRGSEKLDPLFRVGRIRAEGVRKDGQGGGQAQRRFQPARAELRQRRRVVLGQLRLRDADPVGPACGEGRQILFPGQMQGRELRDGELGTAHRSGFKWVKVSSSGSWSQARPSSCTGM